MPGVALSNASDFAFVYIGIVLSGNAKRKEAAVHLERMEEEMRDAHARLLDERRRRDAEPTPSQRVATPGLEPRTPRTPARIGL
ncbi:hypothetical protein EVAR_20681_1 [Eumeta japonica]|uniref:Uncharacterized protein n=1 Tax=Eumeta variegata TaxID=151549 RepID=A0A4C1V8S9_EUMVA|nr:hypothetical protein EVAR_20681_1 [Eumeta japonica]